MIEEFCRIGESCHFRLSTGEFISGIVNAVDDQWVALLNEKGEVLIAQQHIVALGNALEEHPEGQMSSQPANISSEALPSPVSCERPKKAGRRSPGRKWNNDDLRAVAEGFLDGMSDADIAEQFSRTRAAIKEMHKAFECARGNFDEDDLGTVAQTWVQRWQKLLSPEE